MSLPPPPHPWPLATITSFPCHVPHPLPPAALPPPPPQQAPRQILRADLPLAASQEMGRFSPLTTRAAHAGPGPTKA